MAETTSSAAHSSAHGAGSAVGDRSKNASPTLTRRSATSSSLGRSGKRGRKGREESDIRQAILAFKVLTEDETKDVMSLSPEELTQKLASKHNFTDSQHNLKSAALLDFYVAAILWARDRKFNEKQLSSFYTALHTLLTNIQERNLSLEENIAELKKFLAGVGVENPNSSQCGGLDVFSFAQATEVVDYISSTLFQHYKLYQYLFTEEKAAEVIELQKAVEVPEKLGTTVPWPAPLSEAIPEELYTRYVAPPPPTQPGRAREGTHGLQTMASTVSGVSAGSGQSGALSGLPPGSPEKSALGVVHEPPAAAGEQLSGTATAAGGTSGVPATTAQPPAATAGEVVPSAEQSNMFARLAPQVIRQMVSEVCAELVRGLETDVASKLREKENVLLTRINKVHNVAAAPNAQAVSNHK